MDRVISGTSVRHRSVTLAEVSLRLQYVTEVAECGWEPFILTVTGAKEIGSRVGACPSMFHPPMSGQLKVSLDTLPWLKGPEPTSTAPSFHTFVRPGQGH